MLQRLDATTPYASDTAECAVKTAPASTFKIPHSLVALRTGVILGPRQIVKWDGAKQPYPSWEHDQSMDSAVKSSVVWFFRRTARLIGKPRMQQALRAISYGSDTFEGDVTSFWLNGDLVVSPEEQLDFLIRLARYRLPARREHVDAVMESILMPPGQITNATGTHEFTLDWPRPLVVRAKTGNTQVGDERVSWLVGYVESNGVTRAFVSRVRARQNLPGTAGAELARRVLNERGPGR